jgi:hypothetical protein
LSAIAASRSRRSTPEARRHAAQEGEVLLGVHRLPERPLVRVAPARRRERRPARTQQRDDVEHPAGDPVALRRRQLRERVAPEERDEGAVALPHGAAERRVGAVEVGEHRRQRQPGRREDLPGQVDPVHPHARRRRARGVVRTQPVEQLQVLAEPAEAVRERAREGRVGSRGGARRRAALHVGVEGLARREPRLERHRGAAEGEHAVARDPVPQHQRLVRAVERLANREHARGAHDAPERRQVGEPPRGGVAVRHAHGVALGAHPRAVRADGGRLHGRLRRGGAAEGARERQGDANAEEGAADRWTVHGRRAEWTRERRCAAAREAPRRRAPGHQD